MNDIATPTTPAIKIGKPDIEPSAPSHIKGVPQGNTTKLKKVRGMIPAGWEARGTAERSTGINASKRNPIDSRMPNLSPA